MTAEQVVACTGCGRTGLAVDPPYDDTVCVDCAWRELGLATDFSREDLMAMIIDLLLEKAE